MLFYCWFVLILDSLSGLFEKGIKNKVCFNCVPPSQWRLVKPRPRRRKCSATSGRTQGGGASGGQVRPAGIFFRSRPGGTFKEDLVQFVVCWLFVY